MVKGLDVFRSYFSGFEEQYVLIGGAACDIVFDIDSLANEPFDQNLLKEYGLNNNEVIENLKRIFM